MDSATENPASIEGVEVRLIVPRTVAPGATVPIRIRVTNTTARALDLYLRGRQITVDISIIDSAGRKFWRRLEGETIPAILRIVTLAPGKGFTMTYEWDQKDRRGRLAPPGVYSVRAEVLTDGATSLLANDVTFVIADPDAAV